jgi:glucosamine kinase
MGVDGGGTRTRVVVLDGEGNELGRAEGPGAVAEAGDPAAAAGAVAEACTRAVSAAGLTGPADALWVGLAGAGREDARSAVEIEVERMGLARTVHVDTDVRAAFHDAFREGPGVLLISGTGSIAWGRAEDGREARVGGWGHHIGDEGSAWAIGLDALRRVARQADGRAPDTLLQAAVLRHLGLDGVEGLVTWVGAASKADVAALAPLVAKASGDGDAVAGEILARAVEDLERHVLALLENLGPWKHPPEVALAGGLLGPGRVLRIPLVIAMRRHGLRVTEREPDAVAGAGTLALGMGSG